MTKAEQDGLAKLADCRRRIDDVDLRLLKLLNERTSIVEEIGRIKQSLSLPIYEPKREDQVFENVVSHNSGPLAGDSVRRVFERIIDEMRTIQRERMLEKGSAPPRDGRDRED
jgi:chorismate mutase